MALFADRINDRAKAFDVIDAISCSNRLPVKAGNRDGQAAFFKGGSSSTQIGETWHLPRRESRT